MKKPIRRPVFAAAHVAKTLPKLEIGDQLYYKMLGPGAQGTLFTVVAVSPEVSDKGHFDYLVKAKYSTELSGPRSLHTTIWGHLLFGQTPARCIYRIVGGKYKELTG